jgi:hypothetical protein
MSASDGAAGRTGGLRGGTQVLVKLTNQGSSLVNGGFKGGLPHNVAHRVQALGGIKPKVKRLALGFQGFQEGARLPECHQTDVIGSDHSQCGSAGEPEFG